MLRMIADKSTVTLAVTVFLTGGADGVSMEDPKPNDAAEEGG